MRRLNVHLDYKSSVLSSLLDIVISADSSRISAYVLLIDLSGPVSHMKGTKPPFTNSLTYLVFTI